MDTISRPLDEGSNDSSPPQDHPLFQAKFNPAGSSAPKKKSRGFSFKRGETKKTVDPKINMQTQVNIPNESKKDGNVDVFQQGTGKKAKFKTSKSKKRKKTIVTILIIVLIISAGVLGYSVYYYSQGSSAATKAANPSASPSFNTDSNVERIILKKGDLVKFGDTAENTFTVDEIRLNNVSHPEYATMAYVYIKVLTGQDSTNIIEIKEKDKISFASGKFIYLVDSFEFSPEDSKKATLCKISIHEMNQEVDESTKETDKETSAEETSTETDSEAKTDSKSDTTSSDSENTSESINN